MQLITVEELAGRLCVTKATIRSWARRGMIPSLRVGSRPILFDPAEVDRVLRERIERNGDKRTARRTC